MRINTFEEYEIAYKKSVEDPEGFWGEVAQKFEWKKPWTKVLDWNFEEPNVKWFVGGKMNITENLLDRHVRERPNQPAIVWEPNDKDDESVTLTYKVLHERVSRFANVLKSHGVEKGDRICIYMPMIPELAIAVLACARIGAIHSVVFGGFSAKSIADRVNDANCKMVITTDGAYRGKKKLPMKETVDDALIGCPMVEKVIVATRTRTPISMIKGRDYWWEEEVKKVSADCPATEMDSEDPLFILYTSGSTGKPKGVVHTCGGYMVYTTYTFTNVFQYNPGDVYFCTADIGWITGHSYIIYGPLAAGATSVLFEGVPTYPDAGRFWDIVERHKVNIFYTAPTAIRSLMGFGKEFWENKDLSSLKVLGSVGEPINEEAWHWYNENIGKGNCTICDSWWQTETGGIMISPLANITPTKPTFATLPLPGIQPELVDENGEVIEGNGVNGNLVIKFPWPSIIRTTWGDHDRCKQVYFSTYPNRYFTGDGCMRDEDGYYRITGRVDDVINVSGHRIGTAEVEDALNSHTGVIESAVVGYPHEIKGQGIFAYIIMESLLHDEDLTKRDILATVTRIIGPIAKPDEILFVSGLPKTRSGKIMRRILRKVAEGDTSNLGDISTLLDPSVVDEIVEKVSLK
ncbi:acetate--CoA ligase [Arcticibacterium luteifluviistationis]|uniref:Acetate--CoA ligase n=1 Tax=Arcticibacterium luteifluviistationis TaxID=1784714 RepID=A0A2Z4GC40_9BACT|nr:acetate--CoA ligase [Arcticibacterium luteifluviistationis]AWV98707.1 acetate--CoA ligase [Arcticibacterium luteifluviistationis]